MKVPIAGLLLLPAIGFADTGAELFSEVMYTARACSYGKSYTEQQSCFIQSAPSKCEKEARDSRLGQFHFMQFRNCVISCADSGVFSRTFGECSRSLVTPDASVRVGTLELLGCLQVPQAHSKPRQECLDAANGK